MAGGRRFQKSAETQSAGPLTADSGHKTVVVGLLQIYFSTRPRSVLIREMKRTKTKSRSEAKARPAAGNSEQNVPYRKPALRSEAFARALIDAKACLNDSETL